MTTRTPEELEEKLHYHFKNKELLITALTHSSYANESKTPTLYNERLEFLGDSVLSLWWQTICSTIPPARRANCPACALRWSARTRCSR